MPLRDCFVVKLPTISDSRGNLTALEGCGEVPFPIRRVFYLYAVPEGETRGGHAHKVLQQFVICVHGSFVVSLDDGRDRENHRLSSPDHGLYVGPKVWTDLTEFSPGAVCLVLASDHFDEQDYLRNYSEFIASVRR